MSQSIQEFRIPWAELPKYRPTVLLWWLRRAAQAIAVRDAENRRLRAELDAIRGDGPDLDALVIDSVQRGRAS